MGHAEALAQLHTAFNHFAPTGVEQRALARARADMEQAREPDEQIAIMIAGAILDGLRYGNWPT